MRGEPGSVWLFFGGRQVGGAFSSPERAEEWIAEHRLSGVLTEYPLDTGAFDHVRASGVSIPDTDPEAIANYVSARQDHFHYRHGLPAVEFYDRAEAAWHAGDVEQVAGTIWDDLVSGTAGDWTAVVLEACCRAVAVVPDEVTEIRQLAGRPSRWREFPRRGVRARTLIGHEELRAHHDAATLALIELAGVASRVLGHVSRDEGVDRELGARVVVLAREVMAGRSDGAAADVLAAVRRWW